MHIVLLNRIVRSGQFIAETDLVYGSGGRRVQNQGAARGGMKSLNSRHQRAENTVRETNDDLTRPTHSLDNSINTFIRQTLGVLKSFNVPLNNVALSTTFPLCDLWRHIQTIEKVLNALDYLAAPNAYS